MTLPSLTAIAVYTVASFGFAWIVGHAKISLPARAIIAQWGRGSEWLVELIECPGCLGTWAGGFVCFALAEGDWGARLLASMAGSFYTAGANIILASVTGLVPLGTQKTDEEEILK